MKDKKEESDKDKEDLEKTEDSKESKEKKTKTSENAQDSKEKEEKEEEKEIPLTKEEELQKKLDETEKAVKDEQDKHLRLAAEFDNYRKRTLKEKTELILNGGAKTLEDVLPIIDDFERALKSAKNDTEMKKDGIELIYNKFIKVLDQNGVKAIDTEDKELDTEYHEAIAMIPAPSEDKKGKIIDCVQKGYTMNNKVLRHAKVVVGK
ncbi:MAG: nucleotide exchange factor GrpE [Bacteroidaceae bacterium]|nr:nucleotide exchange factor GrpE [Bacteroidaceae bacterium]